MSSIPPSLYLFAITPTVHDSNTNRKLTYPSSLADTEPNVGVKVDGILAPGMYKGNEVNLLPYFDGTLASTNRGGDMGVSVNFLDGGAAEPLKKNMPANDEKSQQ